MTKPIIHVLYVAVALLPSAWFLRLIMFLGALPGFAVLYWVASGIVVALSNAIAPSPEHPFWAIRYGEILPGWLLGYPSLPRQWSDPVSAASSCLVGLIGHTALLAICAWVVLHVGLRLPLLPMRRLRRSPVNWVREVCARQAMALRSLCRRRPRLAWFLVGTPLASANSSGHGFLLFFGMAILASAFVFLGALLRDLSIIAGLPPEAFRVQLDESMIVDTYDDLLPTIGGQAASSRWDAVRRVGILSTAVPLSPNLAVGIAVQAIMLVWWIGFGLLVLTAGSFFGKPSPSLASSNR